MKRQLTADEIQDVIQKLESYLADLKARWDQENPGNRSWFAITRTYLITGTRFLLGCLDELINFVENMIPEGTDKKAAVLTVVGRMFDYIVTQAFPFWLRPFAGTIKEIVVNVIISQMIDFIVAKYNAGFWEAQQQQEADNGETTQA